MNRCRAIRTVAASLLIALGISCVSDLRNNQTAADTTTTTPLADTLHYDPHTGLVIDTNLALVVANCSACHTTDLIKENRFTRDGWVAKIRWMQKEQNLWDLGKNEKNILDYLEKYYSPSSLDARAQMRREPLKDIQWYDYP
ncbi:hypothetical protein [Parapedobacter sp.]